MKIKTFCKNKLQIHAFFSDRFVVAAKQTNVEGDKMTKCSY
ncbi:hypothetical protein M2135_001383 [Parabacteroides sp. PF5-9]|nr:hypothetical protein [Parabacteroides sp. PF5-9]